MKASALFVLIAILVTSIPVVTFADEEPADTLDSIFLLAKNKGPILWYVRDEDKRALMEKDMELMRLYNEAQKAIRRRNAIGAAFFYPGVSILAIGVCGGLFQNTLGLYDDTTGQQMLVGGALIGTALIIPGIVFKAKESKAEKEYLKYIKTKYDIIPILRKDDDGNNLYSVNFAVRF